MSSRSTRLAAGCLVLWLAACSANGGHPPAVEPHVSPRDITAKDWAGPPLKTAHIVLPDAFGGKHRLEVEIADTPDARTRGLMWRTDLPEGKGMLFIFPEEEVQSFWMRNTLIPLDMLFINQERRVLGVVEHAEPKTTSPRGVNRPTLYVLEVPSGWVERSSIGLGAVAAFEGVPFGPAAR